jgi:hypothetical protein
LGNASHIRIAALPVAGAPWPVERSDEESSKNQKPVQQRDGLFNRYSYALFEEVFPNPMLEFDGLRANRSGYGLKKPF